jgi:hypothetical protein
MLPRLTNWKDAAGSLNIPKTLVYTEQFRVCSFNQRFRKSEPNASRLPSVKQVPWMTFLSSEEVQVRLLGWYISCLDFALESID